MSKHPQIRSTNQSQTRRTSRSSLLPVAAIVFVTAVTGTAVGFVAAFSIAMPMMRQALASEMSGARAQLAASVTPSEEGCFEPATSGEVLGAETASAISGEQAPGGQSNQSSTPGNVNKTFITKLVGGQFTNNASAIKDTGPDSSNQIITKNVAVTKVTNTNDVKVTSTNDQYATTGAANVSDNTNGGPASTGAADDSNGTSLALTINN